MMPFQVGSWVTLKAASKRSRDRRDAETPALITALSIEGAGAATLVSPNPLALGFGFKGHAWKRQEGVPVEMLKPHQGTAPLEAALLAALRAERFGAKQEIHAPQKRALSPEPAEESKEARGLYRWLRPRTEAVSHVAVEAKELKTGLRRWMKPGSVWEADTDPLASLRVAMQPFRESPNATPAPHVKAGEIVTREKEAGATEKADATRKDALKGGTQAEAAVPISERMQCSIEEGVSEDAHEQLSIPSQKQSASPRNALLRSARADTPSSAVGDAHQFEFIVCESHEEESCVAPPPSPQSPFARRAAGCARTPSPQKASVEPATPDKFTKLVARAMARKQQMPKAELYEILKTEQGCSIGFFEEQLQTLDEQNKVVVVDEMIFSLA
eukprot:CAMPEP_0179049312 /NCGR_PEP_ID=MMETSP0796-20121207/20148_1 /TAXON_ID=73915 /ORGANISM="Pyrodinium bahamense, Strain pbaha01" /LENGTH=386 /DNA_ID=CAMNT_0020745785 /DNA_START=36 /DNA_END=1196 /DNA_ORIENTATION=+